MEIKVRRAKVKDIPQIIVLAKKFWDTTKYFQQGIPFCPDAMTNLTRGVVQIGIAQVAEVDKTLVGFILVVIMPCPFNNKFNAGTEIMFYVEDEYRASGTGKSLIRQAEHVASQLGLKYLSMIALSTSPKHIGRFYGQLGYDLSETSYTKDLG